MLSSLRLFVGFIGFVTCITAICAQTPDYQNVGRAPTEAEVKAWDITVGPDGKGLPPGSGTAKEGAPIFAEKCAACHGQNLEGTQLGPALMGGSGTLTSIQPKQTVGSYWPFATTVWDWVNRAMPRGHGQSLGPSEVYSLTAFVLFRNGIVRESDVMDATTLPKIHMPNRDNFVPVNTGEIWEHNKRACHTGTCP
jgi:cytochrome c